MRPRVLLPGRAANNAAIDVVGASLFDNALNRPGALRRNGVAIDIDAGEAKLRHVVGDILGGMRRADREHNVARFDQCRYGANVLIWRGGPARGVGRPCDAHSTVWALLLAAAPTEAPMAPGCRSPIHGMSFPFTKALVYAVC